MLEAIKFAHEHIKNQISAQLRLQAAFGKKFVPTTEKEKTSDSR
jgi:polyribonucleotide nucleotidyltransferase